MDYKIVETLKDADCKVLTKEKLLLLSDSAKNFQINSGFVPMSLRIRYMKCSFIMKKIIL